MMIDKQGHTVVSKRIRSLEKLLLNNKSGLSQDLLTYLSTLKTNKAGFESRISTLEQQNSKSVADLIVLNREFKNAQSRLSKVESEFKKHKDLLDNFETKIKQMDQFMASVRIPPQTINRTPMSNQPAANRKKAEAGKRASTTVFPVLTGSVSTPLQPTKKAKGP